MANRVLIGNRATGGYGLYVSRLTSDVLTCASDKLLFSTNHGETGSNFVTGGHFQAVPVSGGTGTNAPVTSQTTTIAASGTGTPSYQDIASTQIMLWGSSPALTGAGEGSNVNQTYTYSSLGSTSATLTNNGNASRTIRSVTFNLLSTSALF
jgi:hypothetical protein